MRGLSYLLLFRQRGTAREDNRDLRFDLGTYWIKVARLAETVLSDLLDFLLNEEMETEKKQKKKKDT